MEYANMNAEYSLKVAVKVTVWADKQTYRQTDRPNTICC